MDQPQPSRHVTAPLSADQLARDFAAAEIARDGVDALGDALRGAASPAVAAAIQQWRVLFGKACGHDLERPSKSLPALAAYHGDNSTALFALHTYYALVVKLLAGHVVAGIHERPSPMARLLQARGTRRLQCLMEEFEAGSAFREFGIGDIFHGDLFSWYASAWSAGIDRLVRRVAERLAHYSVGTAVQETPAEGDLLKGFYQALVPRPLRHQLGEYYTPDWLAEHVLDQVGYAGDPDQRLLDPACGSGTFLVAAIRRIRAWHDGSQGSRHTRCAVAGGTRSVPATILCRKILANVVGYDINPVAVVAARANYLMALGRLLRHAGGVPPPVVLCDSILDCPSDSGPGDGRFDVVVGNPPWIAWDNLPQAYREATRPLWEQYGLFSLSAGQARHGGGKKDLAMLMIYRSADRYLRPRGRLGMVVTQTLLQTKGAGDGFRRFRLGPDGDWLRVVRVDDMVAVRPFPAAANWSATIVLEKGEPTRYPVSYVRWKKRKNWSQLFFCWEEKDPSGAQLVPNNSFSPFFYEAEPIEHGRPSSPWFLRPEGLKAELSALVAPSDYAAHLGANSGGANSVYWVEPLRAANGGVLVRNLVEKRARSVDAVEAELEPDLLYPLLRWGDVARYRAAPSAAIVLAQDAATRSGIEPAVMRNRYPRTLAYLRRFERLLSERAAYRRYQGAKPFYSMYNVGPYTLSPIKVVWRRMDRRIRAAVVEEVDDRLLGRRPVVPQETCVLIAPGSSAEAHYLCALMNSAVVGFLVASHSVEGGKGFGTPSILDFIRLRRFDAQDERHGELAELSRAAHAAAARRRDFDDIQRRIDRLAAELWHLGPGQCAAIEREMCP